MEQQAKGSVFILIGSILWIISAGLGVLAGLAWITVGSLLMKVLGILISDAGKMPDLSNLLLSFGLIIGFGIIAYFSLIIVFAAMCLRRRDDPLRSTFPLVIGIIFTLMALPSLASPLWHVSLISAVMPGLILTGAILNRQQVRSAAWPPSGPPRQIQPPGADRP
ncbi:MAG TPA: hypothetical protein PK646_02845 [Bacillota bacterium]|mgnify:CR=1 FL=1|nr:hypothetical protein [Fastidiosipila sp.]HPX92642.1 hypothetical protein [Bacillota bacterium]HQB81009.1 hypothetical protein [Bacillota bacterium]